MNEHDDDDLDARMQRLDRAGRRVLLDDLESIRQLLADSGTSPDEIPVLREIVRPGPAPGTPSTPSPAGGADETRADGPAAATPTAATLLARSASGAAPDQGPGADPDAPDADPDAAALAPQGDLFDPRAFADRLLDDQWTEERERILADARRGADAFSLGLDHEQRARREALFRDRIRERLAPRMEQLIGEAIDELQTNMLRVVRREMESLIEEVFADATSETETPSHRDNVKRED